MKILKLKDNPLYVESLNGVVSVSFISDRSRALEFDSEQQVNTWKPIIEKVSNCELEVSEPIY